MRQKSFQMLARSRTVFDVELGQMWQVIVYMRSLCCSHGRLKSSNDTGVLTGFDVELMQIRRAAVWVRRPCYDSRRVWLFCQCNCSYILQYWEWTTIHMTDGRMGGCAGENGKRCSNYLVNATVLTFYDGQRHMWREVVHIRRSYHDICYFKPSCLCNSTYLLWCSEATAVRDGVLYVRKLFVVWKNPVNAKLLTSFDVERVNITCCGGQMNVRGPCHKRWCLQSFCKCNSTYVL
jgi:hypothetical protein